MPTGASVVRSTPSSSGLYDVLDLILDKGLVIDAYVRVSVIGIEVLTVDLRVVIASVDTYLRFAEAVDRLRLQDQTMTLTDIGENMTKSVAKGKTSGAVEGAKDTVKSRLHLDRGDGDESDDHGSATDRVKSALHLDSDNNNQNNEEKES